MPKIFPAFFRAAFLAPLFLEACQSPETFQSPRFRLIQTDTFRFNNFVDCNMAEAWVDDTFRIFPGKYGEDPVWGYARDLKFSSGRHADEAFSNPASAYIAPALPLNAPIGEAGLHGAVWFETVYQDARDPRGRTLRALPWRNGWLWASTGWMGLMILTHFVALVGVETAYMLAVKRTSLLWGIVLGALWLGEPDLRRNLLAGVVMVAGVGLIALA